MSSRHDLTTSTYRPQRQELDDAKACVPPGKTLDGFLRAALRALADDPERMLGLVEPYWPPTKIRGRRPKDQPTE